MEDSESCIAATNPVECIDQQDRRVQQTQEAVFSKVGVDLANT